MEQVTGNVTRGKIRGCRLSLRHPAVPMCLVFGLGLVPPFSSHAADRTLEYQVKAAFLLNFTKFVEWPAAAFEGPASPINICIFGDDPFGGALDRMLGGEDVNGRSLTVGRITRTPGLKTCQVLFLPDSEKEGLKMLPGLGPVLTVGEEESFLHHGGMIAFIIENRRVRFRINRIAAENAGLKLSSKLLNVAIPGRE